MLVIMPRFEVYDGGILVGEPGTGSGHRRACYRLHRALAQAATAAGAEGEVPGAVNVVLPGGMLLVPDVVAVGAGGCSPGPRGSFVSAGCEDVDARAPERLSLMP
jgi:hypothetical protein